MRAKSLRPLLTSDSLPYNQSVFNEERPRASSRDMCISLRIAWEDPEKLSTFLAFLESSVRSRDPKAILVQRVGERLNADRTARAQFFEVFKHELAVTPLELESLLKCTPTERKRWTEEGKLPVLGRRSFRKAGRWMLFPIFDRRMILGLPQTELDRWRAEHQALVKEHRKAGARAAAAKVKSLLPGVHSGQARSREDNGS